jgi:hypothetical protein
MDLPALDDWTPAQDDKVVNVHWAGALRSHCLGSVVALVPAAGDEPVKHSEGPRVVVMRLLGIDLLQAQYIRRGAFEQRPQDRGPAIEDLLLATPQVQILEIECRDSHARVPDRLHFRTAGSCPPFKQSRPALPSR